MQKSPTSRSQQGSNHLTECVIYARVSSKRQEEEGYSIPAQLEYGHQYAEKNKYKIAKEFVESESARSSGRKQFSDMIEYLGQKKSPKILLVEKMDRLTRNFYDQIEIDKLMRDRDLEVHFFKQGEILSSKTPSHKRLQFDLMLVIAKNYVANLSEEVQKGMDQKVREGGWIGRAPYGYTMQKGELHVDDARAPFVMQAFQLFSTSRYSLKALRKHLFDLGYVFRPSIPKIPVSNLEAMLKQRIYIGQIKYKGAYYNGRHQPLITMETWNMVQLAFKKDGKPDRMTKRKFLYRGLLQCGECGNQLTGELKKGKYVYYRCTKMKDGCTQGYINESVIDEEVNRVLFSLNYPQEFKDHFLEVAKELERLHENTSNDEEAKIDRGIRKFKRMIRDAYEDKLTGKIDDDLWQEISEDYRMEIDKLEAKRHQVNEASMTYYKTAVKLFELPETIARIGLSGSEDEKIEMLNLVTSNLFVKDGKADLVLHQLFTDLAKMAKSKKWWAVLESNQ